MSSRSRDDTRVVGRRRGVGGAGKGGRRIPSRRFRPPEKEEPERARRPSYLPSPPRPDPDATPTVPPPAKTPVSLPPLQRTPERRGDAPGGWRHAVEAQVAGWSPARRAVTGTLAFLALAAASYLLAR